MKSHHLGRASVLVLATMLAASAATAAAAQSAPSAAATETADTGTTVTEVVVTGSLLGGPKDKALPVDVVSTNEISQRGMPTITQLVKTIPSSGSVVGENNRFGGGNGTSTVNLRNLGINRTLVLWNGRRLATSIRSGGGADLNLVPGNAVQRIEVLKDGAAATYGSDAIGGVVNFISRTDLNGLEFTGQYQFISGSKGDYNAGLAWGWRGDRGNILLTANYRARSELPVYKRDWALLKGEAGYLVNPLGGWAATGNPGVYNTMTTAPAGSPDTGFTSATAFNQTSTAANTFTDIGCAALGGAPNVLGSKSVSGSACNFQYTNFDNLVENERNWQFYGQMNFDLTDKVQFHGEVMYADNKTPLQSWAVTGPNQWPTPMLASGSSPGGGLSPIQATGQNEQSRFYIPATNPGLIAMVQQIQSANCSGAVLPYGVDAASCATGLAQAQVNAANAILYGVAPSQTTWRPFGYAGDPSTGDKHTHYTYDTKSWRIEGGFKGELPFGIHYDTNLTYQEIDYQFSLADLSVDRLQLALRGLGGPGCNSQNPADAGNSAKGCYYLNPFSNGYAVSQSGFTSNPYFISSSSIAGFNDSLAQRSSLYSWMEQAQSDDNLSRLLVADATFNGETPLKLWGDPIAWAAGVQYRYDRTIDNPATPFDALQTPCVDSPPFGDGSPNCPGTGNGPFLFNANRRPYDVDRKIKAAFTEWRIPITDKLVVTAAGRIESYEGLGSTTNPKLSARWQVWDGLALRGSVGSTYRAPLATQTTTGFNRGLTNANGSWRANDTYGNPNLKAETADTWSLGAVLNKWRVRASLDYWSFDFKNPLTSESSSDLLAIMFPGGAADPGTNCGAAAYTDIQARFTFAGPCSRSNITGYKTFNINGGPVKTTGWDYEFNVDAGTWYKTDVTAGVDGSYLLSYDESPYFIEGFQSNSAGVQKRAGTFRASSFVSYPRIRSNLYLNLGRGIHNLRWQVRYVSKTTQTDATAKALAATFGQQIKVGSYTQHDITYRVDLPWQTQLNLSVQNVFDQNPPFAFAMQYNYDPSTVNPLGRVYAVGLKKKF